MPVAAHPKMIHIALKDCQNNVTQCTSLPTRCQQTRDNEVAAETYLEWHDVDDGLKAILELGHFNETVTAVWTH